MTTTPRLVLATHNAHKVSELRAILLPELLDVDPASVIGAREVGAPEPVEDGVTFAENALIKARALAAFTGLPALSDDSGLSVDVLGGAPGIFSARWSGRHGDDQANLDLLVAQLADVPDEHRAARFTCAAALATPEGAEYVEVGHLEGRLSRVPQGEYGFGYDPILIPTGHTRSCAQLDPEEKNRISHRSQAFRALVPAVVRVLRGSTSGVVERRSSRRS